MTETGEYIKDNALHELLELPWKKAFILLMRAKSIRNIFDTFRPEFSKFLQEHYNLIEGLTLLDPFRLDNNIRLMEEASSLPGEIAECGCYKGGNAILLALWLKQHKIKKKIYLFDSFEGLPEPDQTHESGYKAGQFSASYEALVKNINELELNDYFVIHKGWFRDTIPAFLKNNPDISFCYLHIDCDLYESTADSFTYLFKHLTPSGIAVFDDFNDGARGEKKAVLECLQKNFTVHTGPAPQAWIKNIEESEGYLTDAGFSYPIKEILDNKAYLSWLQNVCQLNYTEKINQFILS